MNIWILARRNLRIYFRDRAGVFFSFLSSLILIALHALFLGNQQVQSLQASFPGAATGAVSSVALSAAAFSAISGFVVTFLTSNGAFAPFSTIVGTIIGFLAGAYIPAGVLPSGVVNVMNALPFAQSEMLLRQPFTAPLHCSSSCSPLLASLRLARRIR